MDLNIAEIILAVTSLIGAIVTLVLGMKQASNQEKRGKADDVLDFSTAMKNMSDSWEDIIKNLREEIQRGQTRASEREQELLSDLEAVKIELNNTQKRIESVLVEETEKATKMESALKIRIGILEKEGELKDRKIYSLQIQVDDLTKKLEQRDGVIAELRRDISQLKRTTGELKRTGELDDVAKKANDETG